MGLALVSFAFITSVRFRDVGNALPNLLSAFFHFFGAVLQLYCMSDSTRWMGLSTAGERDGRRNDPRPKTQRTTQRSGLLTPSLRSSAGKHCPGSARSSRNHTRARPSGRSRMPACAHGRERKEAPKIETKPLLFTQQTPLCI